MSKRFSYISIFPEIFQVLQSSLLGKAVEKSLIEFNAINLRDFAKGGHKSVDDAPYGGGAGMVMSCEVWGEAIDAQLAEPATNRTLIILTPAGEKFNQSMANELKNADHLIFACGRYEGIDQRVYDYYAANQASLNLAVREISIGDYVLNGGEVAALVITEAVARLIPGVIGNEQSLAEESHSIIELDEAGQPITLLEYPIYTRPQSWRGLDVPPVLLSGNHQAISDFRLNSARKRSRS